MDTGVVKDFNSRIGWERVSPYSPDAFFLVLDIETNLKHDTVWCCSAQYIDRYGNIRWKATWKTPQEMCEGLSKCAPNTFVVAHNGIHFDYPVLERCGWPSLVEDRDHFLDSMVLAALLEPTVNLQSLGLDFLVQKHLPELGYSKISFDSALFDLGLTPEMQTYCERDVEITARLLIRLLDKLEQRGFQKLSLWVETEAAWIIQEQCSYGVLLDVPACTRAIAELEDSINTLRNTMVATFPPTRVEMKTKTKLIPFNPGSRQQIANRLLALGWKPTKFTPTGQPQVDETTLGELGALGNPHASALTLFLKQGKILSMLRSYLEAATSGGTIHGRVMSNGAVTGRMTHSKPNLANIPAHDLVYGPLCRRLYVAPPGYVMIGADAKSLEERMLAHYLNEPEYTKVALGDGHTYRRDVLGFSTDKEGRDQAKTWFYAFLYGAGPEKLGRIAKPRASENAARAHGSLLAAKFKRTIPGMTTLMAKLERTVARFKTVPGLDGRRIEAEAQRTALNRLLQGGGAVVMKVALILAERNIQALCPKADFHFVLNVHDEFQGVCKQDHAVGVSEILLHSFLKAGEALNLNCPIEGDVKVGRCWAETH